MTEISVCGFTKDYKLHIFIYIWATFFCHKIHYLQFNHLSALSIHSINKDRTPDDIEMYDM